MKRLIGRFFALLGGIVFALIVLGVLIAVLRPKGVVAGKTVLEINLETGMIEDVPDDPIGNITMADVPRVRDVVDAIDRAADDERVKGLIARIGAASLGLAQIQEIRDAVIRFRAKKKFAVAYSESFGEVGNGTGSYYLATGFDEIYLQPSGDVGLTGIMFQSQFLRGTLDKLGVRFHGDHRYEYKNALNQYTEKKFTPAHREAMDRIAQSWFDQLVRGIAQGRKLTEDQVRAAIDKGPYLGKEAVEAKLVDGVKYRDEIYSDVKKRAGDGELLRLSKYLERAGRPHDKGQKIALIYGVGAVTRGKSNYDPIFDDVTMGSDTVAAALRAASDDKDVKAIIFRVDSPGGSYVASDTIWREVVKARQKGKPVIVTMGDLAGSGGYFVAMAADKIVAQPGTITGSIGVLGGKMILAGLFDKVGLSFDDVMRGANSDMWTTTRDYSPAEWARFEAWLDRVYDDFTSKVADGRKLPKDKVLQIAKGRIWTGEDAKNIGLVDELGGFPVALKLAKQAAKIGDSENVEIVPFPAKRTAFDRFMAEEPENSDQEGKAMVRMFQLIQPVARQLRAIGVGARQDVLRMPEEVPSRP